MTIASDLLQRHFQTLVNDNTQWRRGKRCQEPFRGAWRAIHFPAQWTDYARPRGSNMAK